MSVPDVPRMAIATCSAVPDLDEDGPLLRELLRTAGVAATVAVWDDPTVDWDAFDVVLVRSTWDYPLRRAQFLAWAASCARTANPLDVLVWNTDKRYLEDLAGAGVPTVPTVFVAPGEALRPPADGPGDHVVKPAVSGSAADTGRFGDLSAADAVALVAELHRQGRTVMVQPYLDGIDTAGETSLVYLGSEYSHAMLRRPLLGRAGRRDAVVVADVLETVRQVEPTSEQRALAEAALDAVPGGRERLSYARVDVIPGPTGPVLLELEATDCYLFLSHAEPCARRRLVDSALHGW